MLLIIQNIKLPISPCPVHKVKKRQYQIRMKRMNRIQSRKLRQYSVQFLRKRFLSVLHFSGIKRTNSRDLEPRADNRGKTSLCATKHNVEEVGPIWDGIDVFERRGRLAHAALVSRRVCGLVRR